MKSTTKQDLQNPNIPKYMYNPHTKKIEKWDYIERFGFTWHHKLAQQLIRRRPELLSDITYGEIAKQYYSEMLKAEAEYKGLEIVTKAYSNHASALQSIMKMQISGEINENVKTKYGRN